MEEQFCMWEHVHVGDNVNILVCMTVWVSCDWTWVHLHVSECVSMSAHIRMLIWVCSFVWRNVRMCSYGWLNAWVCSCGNDCELIDVCSCASVNERMILCVWDSISGFMCVSGCVWVYVSMSVCEWLSLWVDDIVSARVWARSCVWLS